MYARNVEPREYNDAETVTLSLQRYDYLKNIKYDHENWEYSERSRFEAMQKYINENGLICAEDN